MSPAILKYLSVATKAELRKYPIIVTKAMQMSGTNRLEQGEGKSLVPAIATSKFIDQYTRQKVGGLILEMRGDNH